MNELEFQNILKEKGIEVSEHQLQQFQKYYEILVEWNEKMNLTDRKSTRLNSSHNA